LKNLKYSFPFEKVYPKAYKVEIFTWPMLDILTKSDSSKGILGGVPKIESQLVGL